MASTENKICKALGISSDTYNEMMYEYGCAYLAKRTQQMIQDSGCIEEQAQKFTNVFRHSKIWWNWWRREWQVVDRKFLRLPKHSMEAYTILQEGAKKIPSQTEVDFVMDNHVITMDLVEDALTILTNKQTTKNDDTKSIFYARRDKKVLPG
ncbi:hypothetical protein [Marinifilum flexuosum]|uniref:Uncharacterized protein n=1 Tax=Marinifilum flexuosum TaxID=1117708 RepID=A0A419X3Q2_9BACT|nr:hypothetical protein [Marinifilum flexuosum]RKE02337.1 hypothetical protein BXY64_2425 [Marinifilum flexuosum]